MGVDKYFRKRLYKRRPQSNAELGFEQKDTGRPNTHYGVVYEARQQVLCIFFWR